MDFIEDKSIKKILSQDIFPVLPSQIVDILINTKITDLYGLEEIRLRSDKPLMLQKGGVDYFMDKNIGVTRKYSEHLVYATQEDVSKAMLIISNYSLYAIEDELKQGFITITGGHRVGFVGRAVVEDNRVKVIKNISGLNIRISREVKGCSDFIVRELYSNGIKNTLIVSPPGCGKTTLLRDIVRNLSNGHAYNEKAAYKICVIDERSEIAGCYQGIPQKDVGIRTDVLDACPKTSGIFMSLRSMSPEIIAVDEIGSEDELPVLKYAMNCGVKLIATAHGSDYQDILRKKGIKEMLKAGIIEKLVILSRKNGPCTLEEIISVKEEEIC